MRWTAALALGLGAMLGGCAVSADAIVVHGPGARTGQAAPPIAFPAVSMDPPAWANDALVPDRLAPAAPVPAAPAPAAPAPAAPAPLVPEGASAPLPQPVLGTPVPPGEATRLIVAPCRVALLGDSVGHDLMLNGLGQALTGVGCPITWSRVQRGSPLVDGVRALTAAGAGPTDVIVVLQGYSQATSHRAEFPSLVDQVLRTANGRKVVWTLYGRTSDCSAGYTATLAGFNQHLLATAQRTPNLRVIDYPALLGAHPEYSQHRCPHLLSSGSAVVAPWMAAEVRRLVNLV